MRDRRRSWISLGIAVGIVIAIGFGFAASQDGADSHAKTPRTSANHAAEHMWKVTTEEQSYAPGSHSEPPNDGKLRILVFGAHPDDCEHKVGGTAALWADLGHHVKFVSLTNGDAGHWHMAGGPLARRRLFEAEKAAKILGVEATELLDIHDGELMPTLENRKTLVRLIREWQPDIILSHRPYDWSHPDHHHTGELVRDAQSSSGPKNFCPLAPRMRRSLRAVAWYYDPYERPMPFVPDLVIAIDDVVGQKAHALLSMETQLIERGTGGSAAFLPEEAAERETLRMKRKEWVKKQWSDVADRYRDKLIELYGEEKGSKVRYAEAFQLSELRRPPTPEQFRRLFPFFSDNK